MLNVATLFNKSPRPNLSTKAIINKMHLSPVVVTALAAFATLVSSAPMAAEDIISKTRLFEKKYMYTLTDLEREPEPQRNAQAYQGYYISASQRCIMKTASDKANNTIEERDGHHESRISSLKLLLHGDKNMSF